MISISMSGPISDEVSGDDTDGAESPERRGGYLVDIQWLKSRPLDIYFEAGLIKGSSSAQ